MQVFYGHSGAPAEVKGCVAAIGNFDGVHLGHRTLFKLAREMATAKGAKLAVVTFEPHPREFFASKGEPFRLMTAGQKQRALALAGIDVLIVLPFDQALASLSADGFVRQILGGGLAVCGVVVGENFVFGNGRSGSVETLEKLGGICGFEVRVARAANDAEGVPYASSRIRGLLKNGDIAGAGNILGHPWEMEGAVIHGDKRGRELGFPTANQSLDGYVRPLFGIYAVKASLALGALAGRWLPGVSSLGIRPMFRKAEPLLETHIFDFNDDIYGNILRVRPVKFLRPEAKYETLDALKAQIRQDCLDARVALQSVA